MSLLIDVRDYLAASEARDRQGLGPDERLRFSCETMRLTARLTQMMAWLLTQKAVHAGEIGLAEANRNHAALSDIAVCFQTLEAETERGLPPDLVALLDRSHRLYVRVARLDDMVRRQDAV